MREQEWLHATDPGTMLQFLRCHREVSGRKFRLFACACVRCIETLLRDERSKKAVEVAERYADGRATETELATAGAAAREAKIAAEAWISRMWAGVIGKSGARAAAIAAAMAAYVSTCCFGGDALDRVYWTAQLARRAQGTKEPESTAQSHFLRDIVGNPFRPITVNPTWLTWHDGLIASLAQKIYDSRDFSDIPVLADALEEAGCTGADILNHCRQCGEHVRGCWLVDALLGKT